MVESRAQSCLTWIYAATVWIALFCVVYGDAKIAFRFLPLPQMLGKQAESSILPDVDICVGYVDLRVISLKSFYVFNESHLCGICGGGIAARISKIRPIYLGYVF